jgi:alpha-beta hydrolase superfamily lysophospholipase
MPGRFLSASIFIQFIFIFNLLWPSPFNLAQAELLLKQARQLQYPLQEQNILIELGSYLQYYNLNIPGACHKMGYIYSSGSYLFLHNMEIPGSKNSGTILLVHGYLEHSGNARHLAEFLLKRGYRLFLLDLPGHGLSEGKKADITNFILYGKAIEDASSVVEKSGHGPYYFIGHSTGCAAFMEYIRNYANIYSKAAFFAPLVHSLFYELSGFGASVLGNFVSNFPRPFWDFSGDREYGEYLRFSEKEDPLQISACPIGWARSLFSWNDGLTNYPSFSLPITLIQGDADIVLDWKYNIDFITNHFTNSSVYIVPKGKHILFNEAREIREKAFQCLEDFNQLQ